MAQQGVGAKERQADVGGLGEVLQHRRVAEPLSTRPAVDQRHHNLDKHTDLTGGRPVGGVEHERGVWLYLSVLQGDDARVFGGTELVVVA